MKQDGPVIRYVRESSWKERSRAIVSHILLSIQGPNSWESLLISAKLYDTTAGYWLSGSPGYKDIAATKHTGALRKAELLRRALGR